MATLTKISDAQPLGQYIPTKIDEQKARADIRVIAIDGAIVTIHTDIALSGRGITPADNGYFISKAALNKLRNQYSVACDF